MSGMLYHMLHLDQLSQRVCALALNLHAVAVRHQIWTPDPDYCLVRQMGIWSTHPFSSMPLEQWSISMWISREYWMHQRHGQVADISWLYTMYIVFLTLFDSLALPGLFLVP